MQVIEMIADERRGLADLLLTLTPAQLATRAFAGLGPCTTSPHTC